MSLSSARPRVPSVLALAAAACCAAAAPAGAQTVYTSRAAFLAALGGGATTYTFDGLAPAPAYTAPITAVGPLTLTPGPGTGLAVFNPLFDPVYNYGTGDVLAAFRGVGAAEFVIAAPGPLYAFGIDFGQASPPNPQANYTFTLSTGFSRTLAGGAAGPAGGAKAFTTFFGVIAPVAFTSVGVSVDRGDVPVFDNLTVAAVPEPATVVLVGGGVFTLAGLARSRRRS